MNSPPPQLYQRQYSDFHSLRNQLPHHRYEGSYQGKFNNLPRIIEYSFVHQPERQEVIFHSHGPEAIEPPADAE